MGISAYLVRIFLPNSWVQNTKKMNSSFKNNECGEGVSAGFEEVMQVQACIGTTTLKPEVESKATTDNAVQQCTKRLVDAVEAIEGDSDSESKRRLHKQLKQQRKRERRRQ